MLRNEHQIINVTEYSQVEQIVIIWGEQYNILSKVRREGSNFYALVCSRKNANRTNYAMTFRHVNPTTLEASETRINGCSGGSYHSYPAALADAMVYALQSPDMPESMHIQR